MEESYKYSYKVAEKQLASLSVYNVGYQKCEPSYQWGPAIRDHYLIHHIIQGKGYYQVRGKTYELYSGDTFLVYPYEEITYYADYKEPWEYAWVGFFGSDVPPILQRTDFNKEHPVIHKEQAGGKIKQMILDIYDAKGNAFQDAVEMTGRPYSLLALLMKSCDGVPVRKDPQLYYAQKAVEYIMSHYSYPITVEEISSYVGISRSHLFRCFQQYFQQSPKEYLTSIRIKQACLLLEQSNLSITAISRSVGFEDNLYFSKAFKKIIGVSPKNYEKHELQNVQ